MKLPNTLRYFLLITTLITLEQMLLAPEEDSFSAPEKVEPVRESAERKEESTIEMIKRKASEHARNLADKVSYHANRFAEAVKRKVALRSVAFDASRDSAEAKSDVSVDAKPVVREEEVGAGDFRMAKTAKDAYSGSSDVSITPEELRKTSPYILQNKPVEFYSKLTLEQIEALPLDRLDSILNADQIKALTDNLIEIERVKMTEAEAKANKMHDEATIKKIKDSYDQLSDLALRLLEEKNMHIDRRMTPEQDAINMKKLSELNPDEIKKLSYEQMMRFAYSLDDAEINKLNEEQKNAFLLNIDRVMLDPKSFIDNSTWMRL